jgi:hypothetical protein
VGGSCCPGGGAEKAKLGGLLGVTFGLPAGWYGPPAPPDEYPPGVEGLGGVCGGPEATGATGRGVPGGGGWSGLAANAPWGGVPAGAGGSHDGGSGTGCPLDASMAVYCPLIELPDGCTEYCCCCCWPGVTAEYCPDWSVSVGVSRM